MNMEEQNTDKAIREKLNGFSQQPPSHVWDNIRGQLQAQKRKRRIIFISRIAAAAMVVLAFLAGWYFNEKSAQITPAVSENRIQETKESDGLVMPGADSESASQSDQTLVTNESQNTGAEISDESGMENIAAEPVLAEAAPVLGDNAEKSQISLASESIGLSSRQDAELNLLDKVEALFNRKEKERIEIKQQISVPVNEISKADEFLMAENIRNLNNQVEDDMKWKVGVQVSPGYSSQNSNYSEAYSNSMTYSGQNGNANVSGGISVQMKAGKKWSIESGVYYAQNGQRSTNSRGFNIRTEAFGNLNGGFFNTQVNLANGQMAMNSTAGIIEFSKTPQGAELSANLDELAFSGNAPALVTESEFSQVFEFVEVPLYLRYSLIDANFGVEIMGGLNAGIVTGNKVYMDNQYGNQNIGKTRDISTVNFSGTVGVGVNYGLGKNISLAVEPRFSYYLNSINQNPDVSFRPYRIGVYTGLYYAF